MNDQKLAVQNLKDLEDARKWAKITRCGLSEFGVDMTDNSQVLLDAVYWQIRKHLYLKEEYEFQSTPLSNEELRLYKLKYIRR